MKHFTTALYLLHATDLQRLKHDKKLAQSVHINNNNKNSLLKLSCSKKRSELSSTFYNHKATII